MSLIIAFDYGLTRIGIATGNALTQTATPLATLTARDGVPKWSELDRVIGDWRPSMLVIGVPAARDDSPLRARLAAFLNELERRYCLPLRTVDEALTSRAAESRLRERRRRGGRRATKADIDMLAACLIAEQWMRDPDG